MNNMIIDSINSETVKYWYNELVSEGCGCAHIMFASDDEYDYSVCMGWHNLGDGPKEDGYRHWVVAWKIGRQTHNNCMQADFDIDFEMPYTADGDIDDTLCVVNPESDWNALAKEMKSEAVRIEREWLNYENL